jgi:regulator of sirC expression with transglutaminase-like and TPR domain
MNILNDKLDTTNELLTSRKAINDYDQAITLNPKDAVVFCSRGFAYANLGEYLV